MKLIVSIISTTHVDRHREQVSKGALDGMADQINARFLPQLIEHDPARQIGVALCGKVIRMDDGEHGLYVVGGIFDTEGEDELYAGGTPNTVWRDYIHMLEDVPTAVEPKVDAEIPPAPVTIAERLEFHLDSTSVWTDGTVYKVKHLVAATKDLGIHVYPKDHWPPHFHVISKQRGIDARFSLDTLEHLSTKAGTLKRNDELKVQDFLKKNPDILKELRKQYERMQES